MAVTDPIADFLTQIRNGSKAKKLRVDIPASYMKKNLAEILKRQNFINDYSIIEDNKQDIIRVELKYSNGVPALSGLKKVSKPGLRVYKKSADLPKVLNGLGIAIVSTSKGLLTDKEARTQSVGGEVVCYIW
ncbi:MAG TPA: 30S ribosomal protein S8 [Ignavibacteriaceae bacterium]|jgi:small subunit ribosomal protein S8|nr:30S ribosomal protein S8 [Ignavibacteriaceae bacterium]